MSQPSNLKSSRIGLIDAHCFHERPSISSGVPRTNDERAIGSAFTCYFLIKLCSDSLAKAAERPRGVRRSRFRPRPLYARAGRYDIREDKNSMLSLSLREGNDSRQQHPPPYSHTNNSQRNLSTLTTPLHRVVTKSQLDVERKLESSHARRDAIRGVGDTRKQGMFFAIICVTCKEKKWS